MKFPPEHGILIQVNNFSELTKGTNSMQNKF